MKLYWFPSRNFGDALNRWLWPRLLPGLLDDDPASIFIGIGTLLNDNVPAEPCKVVFGAGVGYGKGLPVIDDRWRIYCVRGPLSAARLQLDPQLAITDPAVLLRALPMQPRPKLYRASYMPHWQSLEFGAWEHICHAAGVHFIDPCAGVEVILAEIEASELLIAEAMHGAIVADALRVPWIPVKVYPHILPFKWIDWCQSLGLTYTPLTLPAHYTRQGMTLLGHKSVRSSRVARRIPQIMWRAASASRRLGRTAEHALGRLMAGSGSEDIATTARCLRDISEGAGALLSDSDVLEDAVGRLLERLDALRADTAREAVSRANAPRMPALEHAC